MKKRILFCLLALMLCLSLCACGGNDGGGSSSSGSNSGSGDNDSGSSGDNSQSFVCEGAVTPDASWELMKYFYGEWEWVKSTPAHLLDSITFREDGTCLLDDTECPFTFCKESTEDCIVVHVRKDEYTVDTFSITIPDSYPTDAEVVMFWEAPRCDNFDSEAYPATFWNPEQVQAVQITNDNLWDYFELKEELVVEKNAFGDITSIAIKQVLKLKDKYSLSYWATHDAAIEFSWVERYASCDIDLDQNTFSVKEVDDDGKAYTNIITNFKDMCEPNRALLTQKAIYSESSGKFYRYWTDIQITRSVGSLYLLK